MSETATRIEELLSASYEGFDQMYDAIKMFVSISAPDREQLRVHVEGNLEKPKSAEALKLAAAALALNSVDAAVTLLRAAPEGMEKRWMLGLALKAKGDYTHALADFGRALDRGFDEARVLAETTETHRLAGDMDKASADLAKLGKKSSNSALFYYQSAGIAESEAETEKAIEFLDKAVQKDDSFVPALFRLAFLLDLNGNEDQAKELYHKCVEADPAHVNALINLAILHEDEGEYDTAKQLLKRVLDVYPNHPRARLFIKDVQSSQNMYYDEEFEKRRDKFQQVLDMPITDFELSVRSRNCLKKMGLRTLGDLTRISESELLSYKNFGETSLSEIKVILTAKGLRLGQALEAQAAKKAASMLPETESPEDIDEEKIDTAEQSLLARSLDDLNFSVRSKKCIQKLDAQTVGQLAHYTEPQLMSIKNFGMISLKEIREKLAELGLELRKPDA